MAFCPKVPAPAPKKSAPAPQHCAHHLISACNFGKDRENLLVSGLLDIKELPNYENHNML